MILNDIKPSLKHVFLQESVFETSSHKSIKYKGLAHTPPPQYSGTVELTRNR